MLNEFIDKYGDLGVILFAEAVGVSTKFVMHGDKTGELHNRLDNFNRLQFKLFMLLTKKEIAR